MGQQESKQEAEVVLTAEEQEWLKRVPPALHPIVKRHGAQLFQIVWQAGTMSEGLGRVVGISQNLQRSLHHRPHAQELMKFAALAQMSVDALCKKAIVGAGKKLEDFMECKADIERLMALQAGMQTESNRSPSGIILNG